MGVEQIIGVVTGLLNLAFKLYNMVEQIKGDVPIPSWDDLSNKNTLLQAKIDAEK